MKNKSSDTILSEVIDNLRNLDEVMAHLENREDGSLFSLIRSNLSFDVEKLEGLRDGRDE